MIRFEDLIETATAEGGIIQSITPVTHQIGKLPTTPSYYEVEMKVIVLAEDRDRAAEIIDEFMDKIRSLNARPR